MTFTLIPLVTVVLYSTDRKLSFLLQLQCCMQCCTLFEYWFILANCFTSGLFWFRILFLQLHRWITMKFWRQLLRPQLCYARLTDRAALLAKFKVFFYVIHTFQFKFCWMQGLLQMYELIEKVLSKRHHIILFMYLCFIVKLSAESRPYSS